MGTSVRPCVTASFLEIYNEELCDLLLDVNPDAIEAAKVRRCESTTVFKPRPRLCLMALI